MTDISGSYIEFYILIYANLFCAEYQLKTIRAFCKDPFKIVILDSNCGEHPDLSAKIADLCKQEKVELITLPKHLALRGQGTPIVLGNKLNFVYNNIVKFREPPYFAFLDQDMFMFKPFRILHFLDAHGMWGDVQEVDSHQSPSMKKEDIVEGPWTLHPWLSFFKYDFVKDEEMNWMPGPLENYGGFDTGGSLWKSFLSKHDFKKETYWFRHTIRMLFPFEEVSNAGPPPYETKYFNYEGKIWYGQIQINNEFIHMLNSPSNLLHPKVAFVRGFLESRLLEEGTPSKN